jgi:hypothetical protein
MTDQTKQTWVITYSQYRINRDGSKELVDEGVVGYHYDTLDNVVAEKFRIHQRFNGHGTNPNSEFRFGIRPNVATS